MLSDSGHRPLPPAWMTFLPGKRSRLKLLSVLVLVSGCARFTPKPAQEYVYVSAKRTFLRDRLAAVSNRVGEVSNGEKLLVLDRARRFVKVKDEKGEIGWIDGHAIIEQKVYDQFTELAKQHEKDPVIATGVLRDDSYLHDQPGRQTDHYYLLAENAKLQLITRASVPKPMPPQAVPVPPPATKTKAAGSAKKGEPATVAKDDPAQPVLQDWWLVRDAQGQMGWVWSRMMDVDIPAEIAGLSEGQRYIGAYLLRTVDDPDSSFPDKKAPEYITVINSWKDGLPYDFDQIRVFTWNTRKHRYETAFRERNLQGYLPVTISSTVADNQQEPVFSFKVATGDDVAIDPTTGVAHAAQTETDSYRLEGALVKKIGPATPPAPRPAGAEPVKRRRRAPEKHKRHAH
ncbi:SH3-like domain-containing protein [Silvibacterium bohemicum]|uniref:SH3-like domain-containing protein n=1 Tax=Silvibacterium bohemicum TaxID=1577686 RepID=A0A841JPM0_9BACT|nr:SH3 domain-containing protein [Silvibacterium bohemicum]MBB6143263.1 SH3-like domain-containing protein [Silvibacterium bohemicum]